MSRTPSPAVTRSVGTLSQPTKEDLARDATEARARLCFPTLSLCLAAFVLLLVSACLNTVTMALVDRLRATPAESVDVISAALTRATAESAESAKPVTQVSKWPSALVAIITVLLVADVVLDIGLIRATFGMRVNFDRSPSAEGTASSGGPGLPGVELLKAVTEAFTTVLNGVNKR
ncbi:hypothetical protein [Roseateles chitosanitabidus]|uniref:hypothetical protein n=1 Tax=Roseateles chitosanitabidus TaxID=65048 RepID=UPI0011DF9D86|nr:hypothetical protein [Roseateles chitosanitabidus]